MNPATACFIREHREIQGVLAAFGACLEAVGRGAPIDRTELSRFMTYFRDFVDLGHHEKEETLLVPALVRAGVSFQEGPVARVRQQHDQERYLIRSLRQSVLQKGPWTPEADRKLLRVGEEFATFLEGHVADEERYLFPLVTRHLDEAQQQEIAERFSEFDQTWETSGELPWLRDLGRELTEHWAEAASAPASGAAPHSSSAPPHSSNSAARPVTPS